MKTGIWILILSIITNASWTVCWAKYVPTSGSVLDNAISPAQQAAMARQYQTWELQQAALRRQEQATKQQAYQQTIAAAINKLEDERDNAINKIRENFEPVITGMEKQDAALKAEAAHLENQLSISEREKAHLIAKQMFRPIDPWRSIDGKTYNAKDKDWFQFAGKIIEVMTNGILISGDFGPPLENGFGERNYFVENFPNDKYPFADGEEITSNMNFVAHMGGITTYQFKASKISTGVETVRRLDYGEIVSTPPPDLAKQWQQNIIFTPVSDPELGDKLKINSEKISTIESKLQTLKSDLTNQVQKISDEYAVKINNVPADYAKRLEEAASKREAETKAKAVAYNQALADRGDPYGLLRMGERYRDGDGVEKDPIKAKEYLQKAANAGSPTAEQELQAMQTH